ncbi:hypothetical protein [Kitasatospora sp. NPDC092286]|uniref:hypothetical protein n=1 Tax=Kitasatospora sp. NPDC092286 TaxID=3364087 RepID=UPI00382AEE67
MFRTVTARAAAVAALALALSGLVPALAAAEQATPALPAAATGTPVPTGIPTTILAGDMIWG